MDNQNQTPINVQPAPPQGPPPTQPPSQAPTQPPTQAPTQPPSQPQTNTIPQQGGSIVESMIPTKNKDALIGYYLGFGAIIPFVGLLFFIPAIIFGIRGYRFATAHPEVKGRNHAIVAIVLGSIPALWILVVGIIAIVR